MLFAIKTDLKINFRNRGKKLFLTKKKIKNEFAYYNLTKYEKCTRKTFNFYIKFGKKIMNFFLFF